MSFQQSCPLQNTTKESDVNVQSITKNQTKKPQNWEEIQTDCTQQSNKDDCRGTSVSSYFIEIQHKHSEKHSLVDIYFTSLTICLEWS